MNLLKGLATEACLKNIYALHCVLSTCRGSRNPPGFGDGQEDESMGYLYPIETIRYAARLYFRFTLSFRGAEEILAYRGVIFSYEIIRL